MQKYNIQMRKSCLFFFLFLVSVNAFGKIHTPAHYENAIRQCFKEERWEAGKYMLDEARPYYGYLAVFLELDGWYLYHVGDYNQARLYLTKSTREDDSNFHAWEILEKVEEETKNYSAAICCINKMLEMDAYSAWLWRRKIYLYRLQGNDIEADRLLGRLYQIYPNDSIVRRDMAYRYELKAAEQANAADLDGRIESYVRILELDGAGNEDNYLVLTNLYLQKGLTDDALSVARQGAVRTGGMDVIRKYVNILCGQGRYYEALGYLEELRRTDRRPELYTLYNKVRKEQAGYTQTTDPYLTYGKLYGRTHSREAFNFVVNTAISRGYYDDALYYINDYKSRGHDADRDLLYKEATVWRRLGRDDKALAVYEQMVRDDLHDEGIVEEMGGLAYQLASASMAAGDYAEAERLLGICLTSSDEADLQNLSRRKLFACHMATRQYARAAEVLNASESPMSAEYEELAMTWAKRLMDEGRYGESLQVCDEAFERQVMPVELLMYACTSADLTGQPAEHYINQGLTRYPHEEFFRRKYGGLAQSMALQALKQKEFHTAIAFADEGLRVDSMNRELLYTKGVAYERLHQFDSAYVYQKYYNPSPVEVTTHNRHMNNLLSRSHRHAISTFYQRVTRGNVYAVMANAGVEYTRRNSRSTWGLLANYTGRDDVADESELRFAQTPGGTGFQLGGNGSLIWPEQGLTLAGNAAWASRYFPTLTADITLTKELPNDWTLSASLAYKKIDSYNRTYEIAAYEPVYENGRIASYRPVYRFKEWRHTKPDMYGVGIGASKTVGDFLIDGTANGYLIYNRAYYALKVRGTYFPTDSYGTKLYAGAGFGTAPEVTLIEAQLPESFEKLNTHVTGGFTWRLDAGVQLGVNGLWQNLYRQTEYFTTERTFRTTYVNLFYLTVNSVITF